MRSRFTSRQRSRQTISVCLVLATTQVRTNTWIYPEWIGGEQQLEKVIIPIPDAKTDPGKRLFYYSTGPENGRGIYILDRRSPV